MKLGKHVKPGARVRAIAILAVLVAPLLRAEPVDPELRQQLAQAREQRLADLEAYIKQGEFPHNHDFGDEQVPYLVDRHGRLCAVAFLFSASQVEDFSYGTFIRVNQVAIESPNATSLPSFADEWMKRAALEESYARAFAQADGPALEVQARFEKQYYESEAQNVTQLRELLAKVRERNDSKRMAQHIEEQLHDLEARQADGSDARAAVDAIRKCGKHRAWYQKLPNLAGENNHVRVKDLKPGPLADWILTSGLTREECAMIQPSYSFLYVACDHCVAGSEAGGTTLEGSDYYPMIRKEQERVRTHLSGVLEKLRKTTDDSLEVATHRLQQSRGQAGP